MELTEPSIENVISCILQSLKAKSAGLYQHTKETTIIATKLAAALDLSPESQLYVYISGVCHDLGKLYVKDAILLKANVLETREMEIIRYHTVWGSEFVQSVPVLKTLRHIDLAEVVCAHHEEPDGSGYPKGLTNSQIPYISKIVGIADRYSALIFDRPYKTAYSPGEALRILRPTIEAFMNSHAAIAEKTLAEYGDAVRQRQDAAPEVIAGKHQ